MADHHDGAAPVGASDHRVFDMSSAALWRGDIHDLVIEGHPGRARQRGHHDASDTDMVAAGELVETDVQAWVRDQVVDDCHDLKCSPLHPSVQRFVLTGCPNNTLAAWRKPNVLPLFRR